MIQINSEYGSVNAGLAVGTGTAAVSNTDFLNMVQAVPSRNSMDEIFQKASQTYHVPENLLKAVAQAESNFRTDAVSRCGAQGVMQLMPSTAKFLGVNDPFDAEQNIMGGAKYLSGLLDQYNGDVKLALAAYNAGSGNVKKYNGIPPFKETQNYVNKVMQLSGDVVNVPQDAAVTGTSPAANAASQTVSQITGGTGIEGFSQSDYSLFLQLYLASVLLPDAEESTVSNSGVANQWLGDLTRSMMVK